MCVKGKIKPALLKFTFRCSFRLSGVQLLKDPPVLSENAVNTSYVNGVSAVDLVVVAVSAEIRTKLFIHPALKGISAFMTNSAHKCNCN